jgi:FlaA1/EpsC-like NDP-sugar epimerase
MSKIKKINVVNFIVDSLILVIALVVNYFLYFNKNGYSFATIMLSIVGVINLIFACIREACVVTYDTKRYTIILHGVHILMGVLLHYVSKYVRGFYGNQIIYWILFVVSVIIPIIVIKFMNDKEEKKNNDRSNTPKFIMNK